MIRRVDAPGVKERLERVQHLVEEALKARSAGNWEAAIRALAEAERLVQELNRDVVNEGRVHGGLSDQQVAALRGTSRSAVQQRFKSKAALLREIWPDRPVGEDED
jgi:hydroxypyruvate isomerase